MSFPEKKFFVATLSVKKQTKMLSFTLLWMRWQVEELQKSLSLKSQELEAKNALANQKLKQMVS